MAIQSAALRHPAVRAAFKLPVRPANTAKIPSFFETARYVQKWWAEAKTKEALKRRR